MAANIALFLQVLLFSISTSLSAKDTVILRNEKIQIFEQAYPDVTFNSEFDFEKNDWKLEVIVPDRKADKEPRKATFYLSNGSMLPESELPKAKEYASLLYEYNVGGGPRDPKTFTEEEITAMRNYGEKENLKKELGTPMYFFDLLYDSKTRGSVEKHIIKAKFLGKDVKVHERIRTPLENVGKRIQKAAAEDEEVKAFVNNIKSMDGYNWRQIAETNRRSLHSIGIAVDILPKKHGWKAIYWNWTKQLDPDNWMLTPVKGRWMPPQKVIDIFEEEGFIWGGKWAIWDNMHFEYHPEIILKNSK